MNSPLVIMLVIAITAFTPPANAGEKYVEYVTKIKENAEEASGQKHSKGVGVINGEKYVVSVLSDDNFFFLSKINADGSYQPIARAHLGNLQYPSATIEAGAVVVHSGYAHHGSYNINYVFKEQMGEFFLSEFRDFSSFYDEDKGPGIQMINLYVADFNKHKVDFWQKRFVLSKNGKRFKAGSTAFGKAMGNIDKNFSLPMPPTKTAPLPVRRYALDNFDFDDVVQSVRGAFRRHHD